MAILVTPKLTAKSLGWDRFTIGGATKDTTEAQLIGRIAGIVSGFKDTVAAESGEIQRGLRGNFRGVSSLNRSVREKNADGSDKTVNGKPVLVDTGERLTVTSGVCYLPSGIQETIETALAVAREHDAKATVSFAIDLFCIKDSNKAGYTFNAENLVAAQEVDPLAALLEQADGMKALPAPSPEPEPADTRTDEPEAEAAPATTKGRTKAGQ